MYFSCDYHTFIRKPFCHSDERFITRKNPHRINMALAKGILRRKLLRMAGETFPATNVATCMEKDSLRSIIVCSPATDVGFMQ